MTMQVYLSEYYLDSLLTSKRDATIIKQLIGLEKINIENIDSYEKYSDIYHSRHDVIHALISQKLKIEFGEKTVYEKFKDTEVVKHLYFEEVKNQTPDHIGVLKDYILIIEVTISSDFRAKERKSAKYALLCKILTDCGYTVEYKIFVVHPKDVYLYRDHLLLDGLDDLTLDSINKVCQMTDNILILVHKSLMGQGYYHRFFESTETPVKINFSSEDVLLTSEEHKNKCFHTHSDLIDALKQPTSSLLSNEDENFILSMVDMIPTIKSELAYKEDFDEIKFTEMMVSKSNTDELRSVLPLPFIVTNVIDSSTRSTAEDWRLVLKISSKMIDAKNTLISYIGSKCCQHLNSLSKKSDNLKNEDFLFLCKLGSEEEKESALEGPNRKKFCRLGSPSHIKASKDHDGYALNPTTNVRELLHLSYFLSHKPATQSTGDIKEDMGKILTLKSNGLDYVRVCQAIFREININAMRGDRRHKYIIKPTGADGVYVCLYKGTKLRCGEITNIVWFKIIIDNDYLDPNLNNPCVWAFKRLQRDYGVSYTRWLSCDVHRLDHYIRCYDKIIMGYTSMITQRFKTNFSLNEIKDEDSEPTTASLLSLMNGDDSNSLGLIIMTFLEDKRSTSKMLQNIRYLVMSSISIYPKYNSVMDKFTDAIRSPLQLYYLQKALMYIQSMKHWDISKSIKFGNVKYDTINHVFLDTHGGAIIKLPRPLVDSPSHIADFSEILSEMYFTMLFNKNQDDPTHASFQILDKIIEGEDNFIEVKKNGNHLGYRNDMTDVEFAKHIIDSPKSHQFSRRAIEIGSKLLREKLDDPFGDQITIASQKQSINKTLDEFATFKSSSKLDNYYYHPGLNRQNPRCRCVEGVLDVLSKDVINAFQVAEVYKREETSYHVFKKNQIGGVREILILPITVRIRINILESLSRNICSFDKREILTHGINKNESIKSLLYTAKKYPGPRVTLHLTFDKSKWGPSFVPIQFLYLFTPFKKQLGTLYFFIMDLLIRHQNKLCVLPDRLVRAWYIDEKNKHLHNFPGLQKLKETFLENRKIVYDNESNMGQGILHYTSSLLHLSMITFRDKLYSICCKRAGLSSVDHEDLLSSDDSYTIFCPELKPRGKDQTKIVKIKLSMFLKCQQLSEYLFNCRTSKVKSSINPLIGEFNSLFISNLTFISTLFKFCLASVHPVNTDSFYRMVKESYGSCRQILENGGGLDLYLLAHLMNKKYSEDIYHTGSEGCNNLKSLGLEFVPYHIGYYPIFNPVLMMCFGPEYYNYKLYKTKWNVMNTQERQLFKSSHKIIKGGLIETMAEFEEGDTILGGLMRIEAMIGPVTQLERIKKNAPMSQDDIKNILISNPLIILNKPKSYDEVMFKTVHKLYTTGSKEALKNVASSIYYGRVSATVSADAFYIPSDEIKKTTFMNCLRHLIDQESDYGNLDEHMKFLYPKYKDYDIFVNNDDYKLTYGIRDPLEISTIQTLSTYKIYTKLTQPVSDLLNYKWFNKPIPEHLVNKVQRDFILIQHHFRYVKDTFRETLDQFSGDEESKVKSVLLLILKLYSLRSKNFKGVIYGSGSSDISKTYSTLLERNLSIPLTAELSELPVIMDLSKSFDKIYCAYNQSTLMEFSESKCKKMLWSDVSEEELIVLFQDPSINQNIKKRIFLSAVNHGFITNAEDWSAKVGIILHYWNMKQRFDQGKYKGDFDITMYMGNKKLNCYYDNKKDVYNLYKDNLDDPNLIYLFLIELSGTLGIKLVDFVQKCGVGGWHIIDDKVLQFPGIGFSIKDLEQVDLINFEGCTLEVDDKWMKLVDKQNYIIFKMETGLLSSGFVPDDDCDFRVFGLQFNDFCKLDSFNQSFNVLFKSKILLLNVLDDLDVEKPLISINTKKRLPMTQDWPEYDDDEIKIIDSGTTDSTSLVDSLIEMDFTKTEVKEEFGKLISESLEENKSLESDSEMIALDKAIAFLLDNNGVFSMRTSQRIQHSRKIFNLIKNLKYDIISSFILPDTRVSSHLIRNSRKLFKPEVQRSIIYSLISLYDRLFHSQGNMSPEGLYIDLNPNFMRKFKVSAQDDDFSDF